MFRLNTFNLNDSETKTNKVALIPLLVYDYKGRTLNRKQIGRLVAFVPRTVLFDTPVATRVPARIHVSKPVNF